MVEERTEAWTQCDGRALRQLMRAGLAWLEHNKEHVNALNVFPVPDGDTGTNMVLTMQSAVKYSADEQQAHAGRVAQQVARGALMGARGNSGVILSQILRGFARIVNDRQSIDVATFADGLRSAADTAYKGVMKPVEGTILTIIRAAAVAAEEASARTDSLVELLSQTVADCRRALAHTPEQLPILKQAGVVDSGGQGLVYIFEGMLQWLRGDLNTEALAASGSQTATAQERARPADGVLEFPYDVQFILSGERLDVDQVRARIDAMGDSTVVVGDETTIKVHVHVKDPGQPISYGASLGVVDDVVVEYMQGQMEAIIGHAAPGIERNNGNVPAHDAQTVDVTVGVVAVAPGPGIAEIFRRLGVHVVVGGGQSSNPSTEEILQAIGNAPGEAVVVLPNNKNVLMAAEAAAGLSARPARVVATRTVPQGVSALMGYDPNAALDDVADAMQQVAGDVITGEITVAVRDAQFDDLHVSSGQMIGLVDGQLCAAGEQLGDVLGATFDAMQLDEREIVTLYYGEAIERAQAEDVLAKLEQLFPEIEVELVSGGQPHYHYIIGAE